MADIGLDLYVAGPTARQSAMWGVFAVRGWSVALQGWPSPTTAIRAMHRRSRSWAHAHDLFESYRRRRGRARGRRGGHRDGIPHAQPRRLRLAVLEAGEEGNRRGVSMYYGLRAAATGT